MTDVTALDGMIGTIRCETGNEFLVGSESIETVAQEWIDAGFGCQAAPAWWRAGCFDAELTTRLRDAGLTPDQVGVDCPQFPGVSWGYAYCNSDVALDVLRDAMTE